jgi:predicted dehydrogenase
VFPNHSWSDTELELVFDSATVTMAYGNPWVKYLPTSVRRRSNVDGETVELLGPHSYQAPFRQEWIEFYDAVRNEREPATSGSEGVADVELAAAVVRAIQPQDLDRFEM